MNQFEKDLQSCTELASDADGGIVVISRRGGPAASTVRMRGASMQDLIQCDAVAIVSIHRVTIESLASMVGGIKPGGEEAIARELNDIAAELMKNADFNISRFARPSERRSEEGGR